MSTPREPDACPVSWCQESDRPHDRQMAYLGSLIATDFDSRPMTIQVVAESTLPSKPAGAVVLVDSRLMQASAEMTWAQARRIGSWLLDGARRYA